LENNKPSGRGRQTASNRRYDTERLVAEIYDGTREIQSLSTMLWQLSREKTHSKIMMSEINRM